MAEENTRNIGVGAGGAVVRDRASGDWAEVLAWVLELAGDGVFQNVVGFL